MTISQSWRAPAPHTNGLVAESRRPLLAERAALLAPEPRADSNAASQATTGAGETDHINIETERLLEAALDEHARLALGEINAALARIVEGTFGTCERCGEVIPEERLIASPRARLCIACQRASEVSATRI
jgi:RNA polymerase-binding protein DksA